MNISVISFTNQGRLLADKIKIRLPDEKIESCHKPEQGVALWAGEQFAANRAMVFIGACGIAVRAIAPFVKNKLSDSPVLVLDERGQYVIPILSGHVGGANELAELIAERIGADAVITTATDINKKFAVDLFAGRNALTILNKEGIAAVSAKVLKGEKITFSIEGYDETVKEDENLIPKEIELVSYPPKESVDVMISTTAEDFAGVENGSFGRQAVLRLKPKEYAIGIGCKKGKTKEEISDFIQGNLVKAGLSITDVAVIASIERKKGEEGICQWAETAKIPFQTFSEEELWAAEGSFHGSEFVEKTVGVDNVCERAALAACGAGGKLILQKQVENGMTLAAAKRKWQIIWES